MKQFEPIGLVNGERILFSPARTFQSNFSIVQNVLAIFLETFASSSSCCSFLSASERFSRLSLLVRRHKSSSKNLLFWKMSDFSDRGKRNMYQPQDILKREEILFLKKTRKILFQFFLSVTTYDSQRLRYSITGLCYSIPLRFVYIISSVCSFKANFLQRNQKVDGEEEEKIKKMATISFTFQFDATLLIRKLLS